MFTDLVDSTATAARIGPEAAEELRQTYFKLLRGAVAASGGTEVKNLGDGLMLMYSSPSRALAGAAGMQQAIEHHNRSTAEPLAVRIGISIGEATEEDDDYFGDPVIEAARLCAAAQGGQILATDFVRGLVGRHATQTFVEVGPLELKGLPEPVDAVEVVWEPAVVEGSVPLPGRLVGAAANALFGFFGRTEELAVLDEARKQARSSQRCQVVFVSGEAGMGKTSLVAHVAQAAHESGAVVLFGHADEDLGVAYQPWIEVVAALVRYGDPETLAGLRSAQRAALVRLVPEIGDDAERVANPDTERLLLLEGTTELVAAESQRSPVLVVLDDLHWADTASLQLLRHLIASSTPMNVTVAVTYRDTDLGRTDPLNQLLADLHREANVSRVALRGLDDVDLVELLGSAAGHELDDAGVGLAHALRRETDGNPFFTAEIIRHLGESGGIVLGDDGRWTVVGGLDDLGLPSSVRDVVGRRVARLGDDALRVLPLAAVIGREFDLDLLVELAEVDEGTLLDLMDAAVAAAVLVEGGVADRYRFAHALIQHSLYDELSPTRRQRAHQRIAEALEARTPADDAATLAELAHHWVAATRPADADKALDYVRRAGDAALDALAPDDAIRWYQQALDLVDRQTTPDARVRAELLAALGAAQSQASRPEYRTTLIAAAVLAQQVDATDVLVAAALGFTPVHIGGRTEGDAEARPIIRDALERVGGDATPIRARLLAQLAITFNAGEECRERREHVLHAVDLARGIHDDGTFIEVLDLGQSYLATPDRRDQYIADVERAVAMADHLGDPFLQWRIRPPLIWARYQQADLDGADAARREMEALTDRLGLPSCRFRNGEFTLGRHVLAGRVDKAEAGNEQLLDLGLALGVPEALNVFGGLLVDIRRHQGRLDEIVEMIVDAARDNPSVPALRSAVPYMLSEVGRLDEARELLAAEEAAGFDYPYDGTWLAAIANLTDTAASVGNVPAAEALLEQLAGLESHVVAPDGFILVGTVARPLARAATMLGEYERAERGFAIAHEISGRLQAPYWTARTELDHADLCLARRADGDLERARELITTAAAIAAEYGCAGLTRRAETLLADL